MDESKDEWIYVTTRTNQIVEEEWSVLVPNNMTKEEVINSLSEDSYNLWDYKTHLNYEETIDTMGLSIIGIR
jgi:GH35 family endo-1,4-beta-xylanase